MTNADKYLKDGVEQRYFATELFKFIKKAIETGGKEEPNILSLINTFLALPIKPTLTEDEKVILRRINKDFEAIRRGVNSKVLQLWSDDTGYVGIDIFDEGLFSWIQPRRRI